MFNVTADLHLQPVPLFSPGQSNGANGTAGGGTWFSRRHVESKLRQFFKFTDDNVARLYR
jgi:hypothetical protein